MPIDPLAKHKYRQKITASAKKAIRIYIAVVPINARFKTRACSNVIKISSSSVKINQKAELPESWKRLTITAAKT